MEVEERHGCNCDYKAMKHSFPACTLLSHTYVPWQSYDKAFSPREALAKGTLFPELWGVYRIPK